MALRILFVLLLGFLQLSSGLAQCPDSADSLDQQKIRKLVLGTGIAYTAAQVGLYHVWYRQQASQSFTFFNDGAEWKQLDKAGHAYSVFQVSRLGARGLRNTGLSTAKSVLFGSLAGFALMLPVEVMDGFSASYGASWPDLIANATGATLYAGQMLLWRHIKFQPKFSFHRTPLAAKRPALLGSRWYEEVVKDYNGQSYWLSADLYSFGRDGFCFPKWLNLAVGYGMYNMVYAHDDENIDRGLHPRREYYLALDIDLSHYRKAPTTFSDRLWNTFLQVANTIHIPSPALCYQEGRGFVFYPLYF